MKRNRKKVESYRFNGSSYLYAGSIHAVTIPDLEMRIIKLEAKLSDPEDPDDKRWTQRWLDLHKKELNKKRKGLTLKTKEQAKLKFQRGEHLPAFTQSA